jgi:hypothetical protein
MGVGSEWYLFVMVAVTERNKIRIEVGKPLNPIWLVFAVFLFLLATVYHVVPLAFKD